MMMMMGEFSFPWGNQGPSTSVLTVLATLRLLPFHHHSRKPPFHRHNLLHLPVGHISLD